MGEVTVGSIQLRVSTKCEFAPQPDTLERH